jgi:hypothetical protein
MAAKQPDEVLPAEQQAPPAAPSSKKKVRGRPFPKGKSGNESGRPKGVAELARAIRRREPEMRTRLFEIIKNGSDLASVAALKLAYARGFGKELEHLPAPPIDDADIDAALEAAVFRAALADPPDPRALEMALKMRGLIKDDGSPAGDEEKPTSVNLVRDGQARTGRKLDIHDEEHVDEDA